MSPLEMTFLAFLFLLPLAHARVILNPFPLAVRSPYLNTWFEGYNLSGYNTITSPPNFSHLQAFEWVFLLRVDSTTYSLLGAPNLPSSNPPNASDTKLVVTPTNTTLSAQAGPIKVLLTFMNPIVLGDPILQSIPLTYVSLEVLSSDNSAHRVQVYTDVGLPVSLRSHSEKDNVWSVTSTNGITYYSVKFPNPVTFSELDDGATPGWGTLHYAMKSKNITHTTMQNSATARQYFISNGTLDRGSTGGDGHASSVFAFSHDLGTIRSTQDRLVWAYGYTTDPAISYAIPSDVPSQKVERSPCYKLRYSSDKALIRDFLNDFTDASSKAQQLDLKILQDSASVSGLLGNLVSPAVAQVYGSIQITCGKGDDGKFNKSDVLAFMKNIDGDASGRVTPVEGLYSAFPALMYIDPPLGAYLLEPLFQLQAQPEYGIPYAAADLGPNFPNVSAVSLTHNDEVEQTGNMLIMTYAHARASGDGSLIYRYHGVLTGWADFLTNLTWPDAKAQYLNNSDANLIIKVIIAIGAMSRMNSVLGLTDDANRYAITASQLYGEWKDHALSSDGHLLASYDAEGSWSLGYNLFADKWLETNIVERSIFDGQSNFLKTLTAASTDYKFGLPFEYYPNGPSSKATIGMVMVGDTRSDCNMFAAAMTPDDELRSILITRLNNRANLNYTSGVGAFPLFCDDDAFPEGRTFGKGIANPAQGALFAILALKAPVRSINISSSTSRSKKGLYAGTITGSVIGSAVVACVTGAFVLLRRRRRRDQEEDVGPSSYMVVTPFLPTNPGATGTQEVDALGGMVRQYTPSTGSEIAQTVSDGGRFLPSPFLQMLSSPIGAAYGRVKGPPLRLRRANTFPSEGAHTHAESNEPQRELTATPTVISSPLEDVASVPNEAQGLRLVVESLQREMERLRAERFGAPPSYTADPREHD